MYCGQCGKKVMDTMLFCPFCGSPIVIPDQDEPADAAVVPAKPEAEKPLEAEKAPQDVKAPEQPMSLFDGEAAAPPVSEKKKEEFVPLSFSFDVEPEPETGPAPAPEAAEAPVEDVPEEAPPAPRRPAQTRRPANARKRPANTYIPVKDIAPDDIFMDGDDEYDLDDDEDGSDGGFDGDYDYEDREEGSFFQRHIRGFVGLILFILLLAICFFWASTEKGQMTLARFSLAWKAWPYAELGYDAYLADNDLMAAKYYEKALSLEETNYEYAHSAMVAYYEAENIEASAAMLKRCIAMEPNNPEPYHEMMILYPDPEKRPWEIRELLQQGYRNTGDAALKQE